MNFINKKLIRLNIFHKFKDDTDAINYVDIFLTKLYIILILIIIPFTFIYKQNEYNNNTFKSLFDYLCIVLIHIISFEKILILKLWLCSSLYDLYISTENLKTTVEPYIESELNSSNEPKVKYEIKNNLQMEDV